MRKKTINSQIVICGRGGQGVLFVTRLIDEAASALGNSVISSETHGMAMRGGSVASYVRIGGYMSPLIRTGEADILIALSKHEIPLNKHLLKKQDPQIYVNAQGRRYRALDATKIAAGLGSVVSANLVLLGFACAHSRFPFEYETLRTVLESISPGRFVQTNLNALSEGFNSFNHQH